MFRPTVVLLTVVTQPNGYYTQRGWHTSKKERLAVFRLCSVVIAASEGVSKEQD